MKTEAEVDGQCKCGLDGEGTVGGKTHTRAVGKQLVIDPTWKVYTMRWKNTQLTALRYPQNWPLCGCTNAHTRVM